MCERLAQILPSHRVRKPHPLKERIRNLGLKQADLAHALFCSPAELSRWLNNRRDMPFSIERQLSDILARTEVSGHE